MEVELIFKNYADYQNPMDCEFNLIWFGRGLDKTGYCDFENNFISFI